MNSIHSSLDGILVGGGVMAVKLVGTAFLAQCRCFSGGPSRQKHALYRFICKEMCSVACPAQTSGCWPIRGVWHSLLTTGEIPYNREGNTSKSVNETWTYMVEWILYSLPKTLKCTHSRHKWHRDITTEWSWVKYQFLQNRALGKPLA